MGNMALGGGGRWAAYVASHGGGAKGEAAARAHCVSRYGASGCNALHKKGTKAAPFARKEAKRIAAKKKKG
jgi:hypothetical protein